MISAGTTERLILRPLEMADAPAIQVLFPHWEIGRYLLYRMPWPYPPDRVLEDQHVGDADIEGMLKKLIARTVEKGNRAPAPAAADKAPGGGQ